MSNDLLSTAEHAEKNSTITIVAISVFGLLVEYLGAIDSIAQRMGMGTAPVMIAFVVVFNFGLVLYQIKAGKTINRLRNRPYL